MSLTRDETRTDALEDITGTIDALTAKYGERLFLDLGPLFTSLLGEANKFNLGQMSTLWEQVLGVPYVDTPAMARTIAGMQKQNLGLIKGLSKTAVGEVKKALVENRGKPTKSIIEAIQERVDVSASKAALLARDQMLKLNGQLTEARHTSAGVTRYEWSTSGDERVRPMHRLLDGKEVDWNKPPKVSSDGRREHPGGDYQCRCVAVPIFDTD